MAKAIRSKGYISGKVIARAACSESSQPVTAAIESGEKYVIIAYSAEECAPKAGRTIEVSGEKDIGVAVFAQGCSLNSACSSCSPSSDYTTAWRMSHHESIPRTTQV